MSALALLAALGVGAAAAGPFSVEPVRLAAGRPQLVLAPRDGERAALLVRFRAGAVDDGRTPGLTRIAQHVLVEANQRYPYDALA
ncbi:MAG TPA: hypothetical protein VIW03_02105, partial [Anaeromyxobacter sp.]